jgi:hypothetical protein
VHREFLQSRDAKNLQLPPLVRGVFETLGVLIGFVFAGLGWAEFIDDRSDRVPGRMELSAERSPGVASRTEWLGRKPGIGLSWGIGPARGVGVSRGIDPSQGSGIRQRAEPPLRGAPSRQVHVTPILGGWPSASSSRNPGVALPLERAWTRAVRVSGSSTATTCSMQGCLDATGPSGGPLRVAISYST